MILDMNNLTVDECWELRDDMLHDDLMYRINESGETIQDRLASKNAKYAHMQIENNLSHLYPYTSNPEAICSIDSAFDAMEEEARFQADYDAKENPMQCQEIAKQHYLTHHHDNVEISPIPAWKILSDNITKLLK
jgi:hypothetical protein